MINVESNTLSKERNYELSVINKEQHRHYKSAQDKSQFRNALNAMKSSKQEVVSIIFIRDLTVQSLQGGTYLLHHKPQRRADSKQRSNNGQNLNEITCRTIYSVSK